MRRSGVSIRDVQSILNEEIGDREVEKQIEIEIKYAGYVEREVSMVNRVKHYEAKKIPATLDFKLIKGLSREAQEKLSKVRPESVGQASRISGITPCDLSLLTVYLYKDKKNNQNQ